MRAVHAIAVLVAAASVGCSIDVKGAETSVREEKRFAVSGNDPADVNLRTRRCHSGQILTERGARETSAVRRPGGRRSADGQHVTGRQPDHGRGHSPATGTALGWHLTVTAPRRVALEVRTGDGSIDVDDVEGTIVLNSGDGRILASRVEGQIEAHTGDGSIRIDEAAGQVEADSGDGSIDIGGRLNGLTVRTGDGSVSVEATDGSVLKTDWSITTGDGRISVGVPERFDAEVDAHTSDGSIRVDGIDPPSDQNDSDTRTLRGRLGAGGGVLRLHSGDGSIDVSRR
jgi:hypothetical protein